MHKKVAEEAVLMDKAMTEMASMLMVEFQDQRCVASLKTAAYLGEHFARMPWKGTASRGIQVIKARNQTLWEDRIKTKEIK